MSRVLFLVNHEVVIYNFRLEIIERFLSDGHAVAVSSPYGERIEDLKRLGCAYYETSLTRHGLNPLKELSLIRKYKNMIKQIDPAVVFTFTIKPNIYGSIAASLCHVPCVANITGLGTAVENGGILQKITVLLYRAAFRRIQRVFFQNKENERFFAERRIAVGRHGMLPGSGVNLDRYSPKPFPDYGPAQAGLGLTDRHIKFAFISRIMREKGADQYLEAAQVLKEKYPNAEFHVCGFIEDGTDYPLRLKELHEKGIIIYHGMIRDVAGMMGMVHCIVHPTYYPEGLSNVLLEACACARPIITTSRPGCREVIEDGVNGFVVEQKNTLDLVRAMERFMALPAKKQEEMGLNARKKAEQEFDRQIVVEAYVDELKKALNRKKDHKQSGA